MKGISRKAGFAAALVEADMSIGDFLRDVGGVSRTQLRRTLADPSQSGVLTAKIDAFIRKHVGNRTALAS
jgi:hypothetical protein